MSNSAAGFGFREASKDAEFLTARERGELLGRVQVGSRKLLDAQRNAAVLSPVFFALAIWIVWRHDAPGLAVACAALSLAMLAITVGSRNAKASATRAFETLRADPAKITTVSCSTGWYRGRRTSRMIVIRADADTLAFDGGPDAQRLLRLLRRHCTMAIVEGIP